jgi:hypothetical protein
MKFIIKDVRNADTSLPKGSLSSKPDHIQQQLINFVKSQYKDGVDLVFVPQPTPEKAARKVLRDFLIKNGNLNHMYGILFNTLKRYFEFEQQTQPPVQFRDAFKRHLDAIRN